MNIDLDEVGGADAYPLLTQLVVPRPIAWVLSANPDNSFNLAPFSFFNLVSSQPPMLMLSMATKADDSPKDTLINIRERDHFVVHIPSVALARQVSASSANLARGVSEIEHCGLTTQPWPANPLPRLAQTAVAMACRRSQLLEVGDHTLIIGSIHQVHIDPELVVQDNGRMRIDAARLDPLARLGASQYAGIAQPFSLERPQ